MASEPAAPLSAGLAALFTAALLLRWLTDIGLALAALLFCLALAGLSADIFMRYVFSSSIVGMQEGVNYAFAWIFMLGVASLYVRNGDAAMTLVVRMLPQRLQAAIGLLVSLLIAAAMAVLGYQSTVLVEGMHTVSPALGIPEWLRFLPLAIAAYSLSLTGLVSAWASVVWWISGTRPIIWETEHAGI